MHPGRVDVIGAGALVWREVVRRVAAVGVHRVVTSEHDILDGIALSVAGGGGGILGAPPWPNWQRQAT